MRITDALVMPLAALWQQKLRTILTTLGVIFGAFVLAASLSIGTGVQETIERESQRADVVLRVEISPKWNVEASPETESSEITVEGKMNDARRARIRAALAAQTQQLDVKQKRTELTPEVMTTIAALPHVRRMVPLVYNSGFAMLGSKSEFAQIVSVRPDDEFSKRRIVAGRFFDDPNERSVVLSEFLAYRLGLVSDSDVEAAIGKHVRLEFRAHNTQPGLGIFIQKRRAAVNRDETAALEKVAARLPGAFDMFDLTEAEVKALREALKDNTPTEPPPVITEEFFIAGVARPPTRDEMNKPWDPLRVTSDILMPYQTATDLFFRVPRYQEQGVNNVVVLVDEEKNVKGVVEEVKKLGLEPRAAIEFIDRQRLMYLLIFGGMTCVAAVALLVSALGIANTMLMSVLERTREIGIMKAVGADNRHLMFIFLFEGAFIGVLGALVGLLLAWGASFPGDAWVRSMVMRDLEIELKSSIFVFPPWMAASVMLFTVLVTTLAAVYPARHAANVEPVSALRHE